MKIVSKDNIENHHIPFSSLVIQLAWLEKDTVPHGYYNADSTPDINSGWRVLSGNVHFNQWSRVVLKYELEEKTNG